MTTLNVLQERLAQTFEDGRNRIVPVIGSGLHHHLSAHGVEYPQIGQASPIKDWKALLRAVRYDEEGNKEFDAPQQEDATATWEATAGTRASSKERATARFFSAPSAPVSGALGQWPCRHRPHRHPGSR